MIEPISFDRVRDVADASDPFISRKVRTIASVRSAPSFPPLKLLLLQHEQSGRIASPPGPPVISAFFTCQGAARCYLSHGGDCTGKHPFSGGSTVVGPEASFVCLLCFFFFALA
jgi:hypothetical protein